MECLNNFDRISISSSAAHKFVKTNIIENIILKLNKINFFIPLLLSIFENQLLEKKVVIKKSFRGPNLPKEF